MAETPVACRIQYFAPAGHRSAVYESAFERASQRLVSLPRLRPAALFVHDQVRKWHRLAELLGAASPGDRNYERQQLDRDTHRSPLPALRQPSRPRLRRWTEA